MKKIISIKKIKYYLAIFTFLFSTTAFANTFESDISKIDAIIEIVITGNIGNHGKPPKFTKPPSVVYTQRNDNGNNNTNNNNNTSTETDAEKFRRQFNSSLENPNAQIEYRQTNAQFEQRLSLLSHLKSFNTKQPEPVAVRNFVFKDTKTVENPEGSTLSVFIGQTTEGYIQTGGPNTDWSLFTMMKISGTNTTVSQTHMKSNDKIIVVVEEDFGHTKVKYITEYDVSKVSLTSIYGTKILFPNDPDAIVTQREVHYDYPDRATLRNPDSQSLETMIKFAYGARSRVTPYINIGYPLVFEQNGTCKINFNVTVENYSDDLKLRLSQPGFVWDTTTGHVSLSDYGFDGSNHIGDVKLNCDDLFFFPTAGETHSVFIELISNGQVVAESGASNYYAPIPQQNETTTTIVPNQQYNLHKDSSVLMLKNGTRACIVNKNTYGVKTNAGIHRQLEDMMTLQGNQQEKCY